MAELIVALDCPTPDSALALVEALGESQSFYKVGLELYTRVGPEVVRELHGMGSRVFLDLKLHDIPNTVRGAASAAAALGVELLTIHASGGRRMIAAARAGVEGSGTRLLGVTVLTSLSREELAEGWGRGDILPEAEVSRLAVLALESGAHGVVAAPPEAGRLRTLLGADALIATPGIRSVGDSAGDQRRIATPADAVRGGADYLVVGRPVNAAADPRAALSRLRAEMELSPNGC
jgi:orotidine-5'-phosphate decarboxylase